MPLQSTNVHQNKISDHSTTKCCSSVRKTPSTKHKFYKRPREGGYALVSWVSEFPYLLCGHLADKIGWGNLSMFGHLADNPEWGLRHLVGNWRTIHGHGDTSRTIASLLALNQNTDQRSKECTAQKWTNDILDQLFHEDFFMCKNINSLHKHQSGIRSQ